MRLVLANENSLDKLRKVHTLSDLRNLTGGHGLHWGDLPVYGANGLDVVTHIEYEHLFTMLIHNRFDYFHRGANEIWEELNRYQGKLNIVDNLMLFYPHPVYFFVTKKRPDLALELEKGLRFALEDGSFEALFLETHQDIIQSSEFHKKKLIVLKNPVLPDNTPRIDTSWWLPSKFNLQMTQYGQ